MTYLVFDTETSGLARFDRDYSDSGQPKLVQIAGILYTDDHKEIASISSVVQPDGWHFSKEAVATHGITEEFAMLNGASRRTVCEVFSEFAEIADTLVAHNIKFDKLVMQHNLYDEGFQIDSFAGKTLFCTMMKSIPHVKIEGARKGKWPKLIECTKSMFGYEFDGAHDALIDARECAKVYQHLLTLEAK